MESNARRILLVDRKFQLQYLYIWLWVGTGMIAAMLAIYLLFARRYLGERALDPEIVRLVGGIAAFMIVFCILMGLVSVVLTHRVAGAAFRLDAVLKRLCEGDLDQRIQLRTADYLQNLAGRLSEFQEHLRRSERCLAEQLAQIDDYKLELAREGRIGEAEKARIDSLLAPLREPLTKRGTAPASPSPSAV